MKAGWMVLAAFLFATMGVCVKLGSAYFNAAELLFYRGLISMAVLWVLARSRGVSLRTDYPRMHTWRSLLGVIALGSSFYAIAHLPLATAMTLGYMSGIWIAAFILAGALLAWRPVPAASGDTGARVQGPPLQAALMLTVLAGFGGVVMVLRPSTLDPEQMFAGLIGLLSGFGTALAYMQVMALGRIGEPETRTVFYFAVASAVAGLLAMLPAGISAWSWQGAVWLPPIGLLAAMGQMCMTRAYALAGSSKGTLTVASLQYTGIVFAAGYGVLLFGDRIAPLGWAGMAIIIASGIAATVLRNRAVPGAPPAEDIE